MVSVVADIVSLYVSCLTAEHEPGPWFPTTVFSAVCFFQVSSGFCIVEFSCVIPACACPTSVCYLSRLHVYSLVRSPHTGIELFLWSLSRCCRILLTPCSLCLLRPASNFWLCLCFASRSEFVSSNNNPSPESCTSCFHAATDFVSGCIKTC